MNFFYIVAISRILGSATKTYCNGFEKPKADKTVDFILYNISFKYKRTSLKVALQKYCLEQIVLTTGHF